MGKIYYNLSKYILHEDIIMGVLIWGYLAFVTLFSTSFKKKIYFQTKYTGILFYFIYFLFNILIVLLKIDEPIMIPNCNIE